MKRIVIFGGVSGGWVRTSEFTSEFWLAKCRHFYQFSSLNLVSSLRVWKTIGLRISDSLLNYAFGIFILSVNYCDIFRWDFDTSRSSNSPYSSQIFLSPSTFQMRQCIFFSWLHRSVQANRCFDHLNPSSVGGVTGYNNKGIYFKWVERERVLLSSFFSSSLNGKSNLNTQEN